MSVANQFSHYEYGIDFATEDGGKIEKQFAAKHERDAFMARLATDDNAWPAGTTGAKEWKRPVSVDRNSSR